MLHAIKKNKNMIRQQIKPVHINFRLHHMNSTKMKLKSAYRIVSNIGNFKFDNLRKIHQIAKIKTSPKFSLYGTSKLLLGYHQ